MKHKKPKILISKCLEFDACRYDGQRITNIYIQKLKQHVDFIVICPEVEIGLGVPREPIHIINSNEKISLYQPKTDIDITEKMIRFSKKYICSIKNIDGIILKSKSPSCAITTAKHFPSINSNKSIGHGSGLFSSILMDKFPNIPKEEEIGLSDGPLREHFYTSIFVYADFRTVKSLKNLYDFHAKHKLLFMTYNQIQLKELGNIAANYDGKTIKEVLIRYFSILQKIFKKKPRYVSHINTQMHAFGYYKKQLTKEEKKDFLYLLEDYRTKKISISSVKSIIKSWNEKFENQYLINQSYFAPYPDEL
tara:strand:+ start:654 stop:1574 length:921 start_codon:yes stop_codon:yes gene_type:complete